MASSLVHWHSKKVWGDLTRLLFEPIKRRQHHFQRLQTSVRTCHTLKRSNANIIKVRLLFRMWSVPLPKPTKTMRQNISPMVQGSTYWISKGALVNTASSIHKDSTQAYSTRQDQGMRVMRIRWRSKLRMSWMVCLFYLWMLDYFLTVSNSTRCEQRRSRGPEREGV